MKEEYFIKEWSDLSALFNVAKVVHVKVVMLHKSAPWIAQQPPGPKTGPTALAHLLHKDSEGLCPDPTTSSMYR